MLITCPNCKSVFKLPDTQNINQKLRCSICKDVFVIRDVHYEYEEKQNEETEQQEKIEDIPPTVNIEKEEQQEETPRSFSTSRIDLDTPFANEKSVKPKSFLARIILIIIFASICFISVLWSFTPYLDPIKEKFFAGDAKEVQEKIDSENKRIEELSNKVKLLQIQGLRQYTIPNDKVGSLTIIEGKVINGFDDPRGFIQVECSLFAESGEMLITKKQIAGTSLSLFQLQVLNEEELEQNLNNNLDIMQKNTNINPGASTPFMCVFYNPPENAASFNIKIVSAERSEDITKK